MKILTNIQCGSLEELSRHTFALSLTDCFQKRAQEIQLVAVDVYATRDPELNDKKSVLADGKNLKLVSHGVSCGNLRDIFPACRDLGDLERALDPVIDKYRLAIKQEKPDILLINCTYYLPWCLYVAAKKEGMGKIIIYYHGILKKETENYEKKTRDILFEMERSFHFGNDLVILPSLFAKKTLENEVVLGGLKNWAIVPNPIPHYFFETPLKSRGSGKNVGAVIRWSAIKNPAFLNALARYGEENKKAYKVNVVSKPLRNDDSLYCEMKELANFIDPLDNKDLPSFYSKMDVIVCPSRFETYGNVAQEALASGTPALVGPNMGIADLYRELGLDDWIVDFNDFESAAMKIEKASFEIVKQSVRNELKKRLNIAAVYGRLLDEILESRH